jgi:ADP-ribosylglycohydrolase
MLGAIAGDIIGSIYERNGIKTKIFPLFSPNCTFTDDSVLTIALADTILTGVSYTDNLKKYFKLYPHRGYGASFYSWAGSKESVPYNSYGNGAAMRINPVGFAFDNLDEVLVKAKEFTEITHNHPEGVKGAQAAAAAVFLARNGKTKEEIKSYIEKTFGYDLSQHIDEIRPHYHFDISCQGTVPQAIRAFIDAVDFEDAIRNAVSLGGDSDTLACITGGIAQAYFRDIPEAITSKVYEILDEKLVAVTREFMLKYCE